ncbi:CS-like domain-containingprotein [Purpureocillium lavendulum]|uniref:CS-like domain-containingprotein n=1 Tax=Purpureocillium lavendulum TaxID=1247861 RepID=A0AB34FU36_9HYPO|nr:CS-like domain-containingprotein [Purpureocillium lavendulum]
MASSLLRSETAADPGSAKHKAPVEPSSLRSSLDVGDVHVEEGEETKAFLGAAEGDGDGSDEDDTQVHRRSKLFRCLLQAVTSLLCLGVLFASYDLYRAAGSSAPVRDETHARPCGNDAITARNRGCMFDPISIAWLPDACHDFDLTKEFLAVERWHYWTRPGTADAMSLANVMQGQHSTLFVSETYLRHRCVFAWKKLHRAVMNATSVDGYTADWDGMMECEELFRDGRADGGGLHEVTVGYPACRDSFT